MAIGENGDIVLTGLTNGLLSNGTSGTRDAFIRKYSIPRPGPSNLVLVPSDGQVDVSWSSPAVNPNETISSYTVTSNPRTSHVQPQLLHVLSPGSQTEQPTHSLSPQHIAMELPAYPFKQTHPVRQRTTISSIECICSSRKRSSNDFLANPKFRWRYSNNELHRDFVPWQPNLLDVIEPMHYHRVNKRSGLHLHCYCN